MRRLTAVACATTVLLAACDDAGIRQADIVITHVSVVDIAAGDIVPNRTVAIRDGRITGIHDTEDGAAIIAPLVVYGAGRFLIPGLWDMHVHFRGGPNLVNANRALLPLYIVNGVTTVRDAGGDLADSVIAWRGATAAGQLPGPRILTAGPKLDGPVGGWEGSIRISTPDQVPAALDSLQRLGVDYVKLYDGSMTGDVFLAILEEAERRDLIVTGHMPFDVRFLDAVDRGFAATEHLYSVFKGGAANEDSITDAVRTTRGTRAPLGFWNALWLMRPRYDPERAQATFRRMAAAGTAVLPTLHIGNVLTYVEQTDHAADPELHFIDPAIVATYAGRVEGARRASPADRHERRELQRLFLEMVPELHRAGVTILAGSDAGAANSYVYPGFALHAELEELVDAGLTPLAALRAATLDAATFMRRGDEYGHIAEGYRADLVLLGANPLDDIRNTRAIEAVIFNGFLYERDDLDALLASVARP